ncbi:SSU ribosomal protein S1P [Natranaerovirga hydrolytica]|uniref:SSU ribosomal protein S1P n=1 Tax=Natranaerovirga hydrolytica TaxID=680378 RepID=A0A4R1N5E5_9FIRM|nr:30S ribosomal protein S1 [Natranaerovirga hydrolytica]TCK97833.1 SSU ribosomal protein S1P [Natranaerovirga hydrolytica]
MENNGNEMEEFKKDIEASLRPIYEGDMLEGKVVAIVDKDVVMDIQSYVEGIITFGELSSDPNFDINDIKVGDRLKVKVLKADEEVLLSKKQADSETAYETIEEYFKKEEIIIVKPSMVVKGGMTAYINGIRGFIPASLISKEYVEDMNQYLNKPLEVKVIEFDESNNRIILSGKIVDVEKEQKAKEKLLTIIQEGEKVEGVVKNLTNFGAFVDIGGIQGLIRNEDLAWKKVKHPGEVIKEGEKIQVTILKIDKINEKIALGFKDLAQDPWNNIQTKYKVQNSYDGEITRIVDFGFFVKLEDGIEGLVHISEISEERVLKPSDEANVGDKVKVKILDLDYDKKKMSLSIKEAQNDIDRQNYEKFNQNEEAMTSLKDVFGDIFNKLND